MELAVSSAGELGCRLVITEAPSPALTRSLIAIRAACQTQFEEHIADAVVGYNTLTLFFHPPFEERDGVLGWINEFAARHFEDPESAQSVPGREVVLPVYYHPSVAPDLEWLAQEKALTVEALIQLHSEATYFAYATGFAPGFCYLGDVAAELSTPRLATPRRSVAAGSVAIADRQTAVYPCSSPGGWRLIGSCPEPLFALDRSPPNRLSVGDSVRFEPIDRARYTQLGGKL